MFPSTFWLVLTYLCNNRCGMCYAGPVRPDDQKKKQAAVFMGLAYAKEVVAEMKSGGAKTCIMIGGEPTLYPSLTDITTFGKGLGISMQIVSNGRRFANECFASEMQCAGLSHATISVEAASRELHNKITQAESFDETVRGIKNLKGIGVPVSTNLTICSFNCDEIVKLAELMHGIGVRCGFNFATPSTDARFGEADSSCTLSPREYAQIIGSAYMILREKGIRISFIPNLPWCFFEEHVLSQLIADKAINPKGCQCHMHNGQGVAFEPDGSVLPCTHFVGCPLFNARASDGTFSCKGRFAEEWNGGTQRAFIGELWKYPAERCKQCKFWGRCIGGCPLYWLQHDPRELIQQPRRVA